MAVPTGEEGAELRLLVNLTVVFVVAASGPTLSGPDDVLDRTASMN